MVSVSLLAVVPFFSLFRYGWLISLPSVLLPPPLLPLPRSLPSKNKGILVFRHSGPTKVILLQSSLFALRYYCGINFSINCTTAHLRI